MNPDARQEYAVSVSYKTVAVILIESSLVNVLSVKEQMYVKGKRFILRNGYFVTHGYVFICDSKSCDSKSCDSKSSTEYYLYV